MEKHGIAGTLRFTGEPAEKVRGSKPIHAAKGYYDGLDGMISFHPFYMLPLCNTVRWDTHCGAAYSMIYRFVCDQPERWGLSDGAPIPQSHSAVRAPGANDALMMMYMASKALARFHAAASGRLVDQRGNPDSGAGDSRQPSGGSCRNPVHDARTNDCHGGAGDRSARPQCGARRGDDWLPGGAALGLQVAPRPRQSRYG